MEGLPLLFALWCCTLDTRFGLVLKMTVCLRHASCPGDKVRPSRPMNDAWAKSMDEGERKDRRTDFPTLLCHADAGMVQAKLSNTHRLEDVQVYE